MGTTGDQLKGQGKEAARSITGNEEFEAEGKHDRRVGEAEERVDKAESKADEVIEKAKSEGGRLADKVRTPCTKMRSVCS
jgi:uncharacterized protein YjbJ (UPF0337 family)